MSNGEILHVESVESYLKQILVTACRSNGEDTHTEDVDWHTRLKSMTTTVTYDDENGAREHRIESIKIEFKWLEDGEERRKL